MRNFTNEPDPKAVILMYHRVSDVAADPFALSVTPQHFAEQMEVLHRYCSTIPLRQLSQWVRTGTIPRQVVVVTFDDGYADNLQNAKPVLQQYGIPATVFITTGNLHQKREFWWDELERVFLEAGDLPAELLLTIQATIHHWKLGEWVHYSAEDCHKYRQWREYDEPPTTRHSLYLSVWRLLQLLPETERRNALGALAAWAGGLQVRPGYRSLHPAEIVTLVGGNLIDIGAHTVTHPALSELSMDSQSAEVLQSKLQLEEILGRPVSTFAYPYGACSPESAAIVRDAGFDCACSTIAHCVQPGADNFQLPRIQVEDWDGEEFERRLTAFFEALDDAAVCNRPRGDRPLREALLRGKWLFRVAASQAAHLVFPPDDPDGVRIVIERTTNQSSFDIQLNQPYISVQANGAYEVLFKARADQRRRLSVGFAQAHEPWNGLGLYVTVELLPEWQKFQLSFTATGDEENGRIHFDLGGSAIPVDLSAVAINPLQPGMEVTPDTAGL